MAKKKRKFKRFPDYDCDLLWIISISIAIILINSFSGIEYESCRSK